MENWQDAGTSLLLLARLFPKLQSARRAAAARKCVPNLANPREPILVPVGIDVSSDSLSLAQAAACNDDPVPRTAELTWTSATDHKNQAPATHRAAKALATVSEDSAPPDALSLKTGPSQSAKTVAVPDAELNSRLFLSAGYPKGADVGVVLDVQVAVAHEPRGRERPLPFSSSLPSTATHVTQVLVDHTQTAAELGNALREAFQNALREADLNTESIRADTSAGTAKVVARHIVDASPVAREASDSPPSGSAGKHAAGERAAELEATSEPLESGADPGVDVVDNDDVDLTAFDALLPEPRAGTISPPAVQKKTQQDGHLVGASHHRLPDMPAEELQARRREPCILIPFPTGFSQPTAIRVEDYAVHFAAVLREIMTGQLGDGAVVGRRVVVVAFDAQQQELLETCFQTLFPIATVSAQSN